MSGRTVARARRQRPSVQQPIEKVPWEAAEKTLGRRRPIWSLNEEVIQRGQGRQLPVAQAMQAMMVQGQLGVSSLWNASNRASS
jgi:hypothetical protein